MPLGHGRRTAGPRTGDSGPPPHQPSRPLGAFLALYGCLRFLVEFVRLPDEHMGYLAWGWLTMGQALSLPLAAAGALALLVAKPKGAAWRSWTACRWQAREEKP